MKRSFAILISAAALVSVSLVAAQAQVVPDATNTNGNTNTETTVNANSNTNTEVVANTNTNTETNSNSNTNTNAPVPTLYTMPVGETVPPMPPVVNAPTNTNTNTPGMTKILTPEHMKFFTNIKKIGNSLFGMIKKGVKLDGVNGNNSNTPNVQPTTPSGETTNGGQSVTSEVEKILSPDMIKFFTNIKKIGNSLYGNRLGGDKKSENNKNHPVVTAEVAPCVIAAIGAKDTAVVTAKNAETAAFTAAVSARTTCQTTALGTVEGQGAALIKCATDFRKAAETARETFAKAQKTTWETYATALKACKPTSTTTPVENIMVEDGANGQ